MVDWDAIKLGGRRCTAKQNAVLVEPTQQQEPSKVVKKLSAVPKPKPKKKEPLDSAAPQRAGSPDIQPPVQRGACLDEQQTIQRTDTLDTTLTVERARSLAAVDSRIRVQLWISSTHVKHDTARKEALKAHRQSVGRLLLEYDAHGNLTEPAWWADDTYKNEDWSYSTPEMFGVTELETAALVEDQMLALFPGQLIEEEVFRPALEVLSFATECEFYPTQPTVEDVSPKEISKGAQIQRQKAATEIKSLGQCKKRKVSAISADGICSKLSLKDAQTEDQIPATNIDSSKSSKKRKISLNAIAEDNQPFVQPVEALECPKLDGDSHPVPLTLPVPSTQAVPISQLPIPPHVMALANAIKSMPCKANGLPSRNKLRRNKTFAGEISAKTGLLRTKKRGSQLRPWNGDTRLFSAKMWRWLTDYSYSG